jgi:hypothetical protein
MVDLIQNYVSEGKCKFEKKISGHRGKDEDIKIVEENRNRSIRDI